jgi:hypothetical protein
MVKIKGTPGQLVADGVTVIEATTGAEPAFVAVNEGIFPEPLAASPIDGSLFVHVKVVPAVGLLMTIAVVVAPLQYVALAIGFTIGAGLTVMVNVMGVPTHPFAVGVTMIVAITGAEPKLVAVKDGMFPFPLAARPIVGSLLVHA